MVEQIKQFKINHLQDVILQMSTSPELNTAGRAGAVEFFGISEPGGKSDD